MARQLGRASAAGPGGNKTGGSGTDRKEEQADRKEGKPASRADSLGITAHVPRVE